MCVWGGGWHCEALWTPLHAMTLKHFEYSQLKNPETWERRRASFGAALFDGLHISTKRQPFWNACARKALLCLHFKCGNNDVSCPHAIVLRPPRWRVQSKGPFSLSPSSSPTPPPVGWISHLSVFCPLYKFPYFSFLWVATKNCCLHTAPPFLAQFRHPLPEMKKPLK